ICPGSISARYIHVQPVSMRHTSVPR
ncbi:hypothetical protein A4X06_0g5113, partial [Tilletia controversa]